MWVVTAVLANEVPDCSARFPPARSAAPAAPAARPYRTSNVSVAHRDSCVAAASPAVRAMLMNFT